MEQLVGSLEAYLGRKGHPLGSLPRIRYRECARHYGE